MTSETIYVSDPILRFTEILQQSKFLGKIPSNYIINKRRPGLGCTHHEILSHRHSIIIEPYVAVIEVKKVKFPKKLCVIMGKMTKKEVEAVVNGYLNDPTIPHKKFMTTPESLYKIINILKHHDSSYRENYFLLIDECELWIKQAIFRKGILSPMDEFFHFKQKAMVSATPIIPSDPRFDEHDFKILDMEPLFDYKKDLKLITTNNIRTSSRNVLSLIDDSLPVFIFTNCRKTIYYLSQLELVKDDFKVFCAEDLDIRFFQNQKLQNVGYSVKEQKYARFNFLTSRFFSAVDIDLLEQAHIVMITNVQDANHTVIDPSTDAIQIYGRCRKGIKTITHISNIYPNQTAISKDQVALYTDREIYHISKLKELKAKTYTPVARDVIESVIDKQFASEVFNEDESVNDFKKDNFIDIKSTKSFYYSDKSLVAEYLATEFFNVTHIPVTHISSDLDRLRISRTKNKKRRMEVTAQLHRLVTDNDQFDLDPTEYRYELQRLKSEDEFIFNAYFEIGFEKIHQLNYSKPFITDAIFQIKKDEGKNHMLMIDKIITTFPLQVKLYSDDIKEKLQSIYTEFNYQKKPGVIYKAKGADITDYFECKLHNGKQQIDGAYKSWYKLFSSKYKMSSDLQYLTNR